MEQSGQYQLDRNDRAIHRIDHRSCYLYFSVLEINTRKGGKFKYPDSRYREDTYLSQRQRLGLRQRQTIDQDVELEPISGILAGAL